MKKTSTTEARSAQRRSLLVDPKHPASLLGGLFASVVK
jgi:hypothetical protein